MKNETEHTISRLTTALIASAFVICIAAFAVDQIWGIARVEFVFRALAGLVVLGMVLCVLAGWWASVRYFLSRSRAPASGAEYVLLATVVFMPIASIYVLRSIRRREAEVA